jgi:hypothetical protein
MRMKITLHLILACGLIGAISSCKKEEYKGDAVFWQKTGNTFGTTVVSIDGVSSNITSDYSSAPSCGASGCAVFNDLEVGSHSYSASDGTSTWNGSITITRDNCTKYELY